MLSTVEKVLALKRVELFSHIPGEELVRIARITREVSFQAHDSLMVEGEMGDALYLTTSGQVQVLVHGREVARLGENECIGEMAILDSEPRSATVEALTDVSALKIEKEDFDDIILERSEIARGVIRVLLARLRKATSGA